MATKWARLLAVFVVLAAKTSAATRVNAWSNWPGSLGPPDNGAATPALGRTAATRTAPLTLARDLAGRGEGTSGELAKMVEIAEVGAVPAQGRGLVVDDDGQAVLSGPATLAPSPSPSRPPTRIFGVSHIIFLL